MSSRVQDEASIELAEQPETYAPIYMRTEDGEVLLEDFANGFFTAMHLDMNAWTPFVDDPEFGLPLAAILGHSTLTGGSSLIAQLDDQPSRALVDTAIAALSLPTVIVQEGGYLCPELGDNLESVLTAFC